MDSLLRGRGGGKKRVVGTKMSSCLRGRVRKGGRRGLGETTEFVDAVESAVL